MVQTVLCTFRLTSTIMHMDRSEFIAFQLVLICVQQFAPVIHDLKEKKQNSRKSFSYIVAQ